MRQVNQFIGALHPHAVDVGQRAALGVFGVGQQGSGGGMGQRQILRAPGAQAGGVQVAEQGALTQPGVKLPVGPHTDRHAVAQITQPGLKRWRGTGAENQLARANAQHPVRQVITGNFSQMHLALGHAQPGQPAAVARALVHCQQH